MAFLINIKLFKQKSDKCLSSSIPHQNACKCTKRLISALQFYQSLNMVKKNDQETLVRFCQKIYKALLDDYVHLIMIHNEYIEDIYNIIINDFHFKPCNLMNCALLSRHYRNRTIDPSTTKNQNNNSKYEFYRDIFDCIHCYLFHLVDVGLRICTQDKQKLTNMINIDDDVYNNECFDQSFSNLKQMINEKTQKLNNLSTTSRLQTNNKFTLDMMTFNTNIDEILFMDGLFQHITNTQFFTDQDIDSLTQYLSIQQFDSDAFSQDVDNDFMQSNVAQQIKNEHGYKFIQQYAMDSKLSAASFSIGYIFYYWKHYQMAETKTDSEYYANKNAHGGYSPQQLYIEQKYTSLKDEILNNKLLALNIDEFERCVQKANEYLQCKIVKKMKAADRNKYLHYEITKGRKLLLFNIICIILYCDFNDLCTMFSSTFRKKNSFEPLSVMKNRNREYAIWSRNLRETVQYYGERGYRDDRSIKWNEEHNRVKGPFYCGMSFSMVIPEFNIRLCGPTSTSMKIEVATRFGGDKGIIIELNNNGYYNGWVLRCWNCCWLSNYIGEDERLFIGGAWPIKIENIRNIETHKNFGKFFKPLFYFDCMLDGTQMD
eukprot:45244_1